MLRSTLLSAVVAALILSPVLLAQEAEPQAENSKIDARSEQVLRQQAEFFSKAASVSVQVKTNVKIEGDGMKQEMDAVQSVAMQRPNKLAIVQRQGMGGATIVSDGEKLFVHMPTFASYVEKPAPDTLQGLMDDDIAMFLGGGAPGGAAMIVPILLADDPYAQLTEDVEQITYIGSEQLNGAEHHRLRIGEEDFTADVWVQAGDQPIVRRIVPDMSRFLEQMAAQNPQMGQMTMDIAVELTDWQVDQPIVAERFAFTPPAGAQPVGSIEEMLRGGPAGMGGGEQRARPHQALLGKSAPQFELDLLEEGQMSLAQHKDNDIVILDFWATWCGPCIQAMPVLMEVAEEYKDRNVVLYAVNVKERPAQVQRFLEQREWSLRVPMDDGAVADLFGVTGIPQTVVIGRDGVVEAVHVGFGPNLKQRLSGELDTLLEGGRLAERE